MSPRRALGPALAGVLLAALLLLALEGGLSLAGVATLGERLWPPLGRAPVFRALEQPRDAGLRAREFDLHPDPAVGRVLRPEATLELHGATLETDALGLRARPGPAAGADPWRLVLLGDSVAFGWGLPDEATPAGAVERLLAAHRPPGGRPVEARSVAVPGWNAATACAFLFDHLDQLDPDEVVFLPCINDVSDNIAEYATWRGDIPVPDLNSEDPWFHVGYSAGFLGDLYARVRAGEVRTRLSEAGAVAVDTGLGRLSRARYAGMARVLAAAAARLAQRGIGFRVAPYDDGRFTALLAEALADAGAGAAWLPLFTQLETDEMLPTDPHPSALANERAAAWLARSLHEAGRLPWTPTPPLRPLPPEVEARRAPWRDEAAVRARAAEVRAASLAQLRPVIDTRDGRGCLQVYGGLHERGDVGTRVQVVLRREADALRILCEPLAARPDLLPLRIAVELDGQPGGAFELRADDPPGPRELRLPLPPGPHGGALDVKLLPDRHGVVPAADGGLRLGSFRLLLLSCEAGG